MKFSKKILSILLASFVSSSAFAIDGFMHDAFIWISSHVKDFSETTIRQNIADGRLVNPSPLDLKVGDIFIDINGHAKQVKKITKVGNNITIDADIPELYNVFDAVNIPEQTADFKKALDEDFVDSESIDEDRAVSERSYDWWSTAKLLDVLMPRPDHKIALSINIPLTDPITTSNMDETIKKLKQNAKNAPLNDEEKAAVDKFSKELKEKATKKTKSKTLKIPIDVRWTSKKNSTTHSFTYAKLELNKHGTWKVWKWTTEYKPGKANFDWENDTEIGISFGVEGTASSTVSAPIWQIGSTTAGAYFGAFFEFGWQGSLGWDTQYYSRVMSKVGASTNLNLLLIPSNTTTTKDIWNPAIIQTNLYFAGQASVATVAKLGVTLAGIKIVEARLPAGLKVDGIIGLQITDKHMDKAHNFTNIKNSINGTDYDKVLDGVNFLGNLKATAFITLNLNLIKGIISTTLLDLSEPIIDLKDFKLTPRFTTPFGTPLN